MKQIYHIIDGSGRVCIPKAVRERAGVDSGDVLEFRAGRDKIILTKVKIAAPEPPTADDILELLDAVPKAALFETAVKLTAMLGGDFNAKR
jgi:AbrB family looped-hinge helix DNA binding protein